MTAAFTIDIGLVVLVLAIGGWIVVTNEAMAAVIGFIAYGLLLTVVWVRLSAVDVALTEAAIGGGMTGMLLLHAAARIRMLRAGPAPTSKPTRLVAAALCILMSASLAFALLIPPEIVPTLAPMAMEKLPLSGLGNPVAGVLFAYRALDTLLEKVVLLLALVGIWSLAPNRLWGGIPGLQIFSQPNSTLVFLAQVLPPFGIVFGIYLCWIGATQPGGAFQGGTVLAAMWLLVMIAGLQEVPPISRPLVRYLLIVGPGTFLAVGLAGFVFAGAFLAYPPDYAKALIVAIEVALTLSIGVVLGLLAAGPPARVPRP